MRDHRTAVLTGNRAIQRINIRRSNLFSDSLAAFSQSTFDHTAHLKVRFIGEPAVDEGGPMREFFRLFTQSLATAGSIFLMTTNGILPAHNVLALGKNHYRLCGNILASGIVHGAQSPMCFTPDAAHFLVYGARAKRNNEQMLATIPDVNIQNKMQQVCVCVCVCACVRVCVCACVLCVLCHLVLHIS